MVKSWIVVADSAQARIFDANERTRKLIEILDWVHPEGRMRNRDLTTDRGGRSLDSAGVARHGVSEHRSAHDHEVEVFARRIAERLAAGCLEGEFEHFHLSAPPAFLGLLRKHMSAPVLDKLDQTVTANLIRETPKAIADRFFGACKP